MYRISIQLSRILFLGDSFSWQLRRRVDSMKRLFQAVAAILFGLVLGVLTAKLKVLIAEDSLSTLTAQALAFDMGAELLQVLSGFGALAVSAFALVGLGCMPKTRRSSEDDGSDELVARDLQVAGEECCEGNTETSDVLLPRRVNGAASRPDVQPVADFVRDYVSTQLDALESGLSEFVDTDGSRGVAYATPLGDIDILGKDRSGNLVVVKVALNDKPDALCGNMLAQIAWVRQHLAGTREVRGILIARTVPEDLSYALSEIPSIRTCEYELQVKLRREDSPQVQTTPTVTMSHEAFGPATVSLVS